LSRARKRLAVLIAGGLRFTGYTPRWVAGQFALAGLFGLAAGAMIEAVLLPAGRYLHFGQIWLLVTAALMVQWAARPLRPPVLPPAGPSDDSDQADPRDRPYRQPDRWERRLSVTSGDPEWYTRVVRDRLTALVAERLRQRHGVRLAADPDRARTVLGEELHRFLTEPVHRTPDPAELGGLITRMEEI
jgi:hypothetical protein